MRTLSAAALIVIGGLFAGSCAGSGARKPRQSPSNTEAPRAQAPAPSATPLGPRTPDASEPPSEPTPTPGAASSPERPAQPEVAAAPTRPTTSAPARTPSGAREDGRPNWWFADPRIEGGMVQLCAEALGVDMAAARDEALSAARARLRRELELPEGASIPGESIERAWVWPLPNSRVGPSRYAGYVWIAAPKSGAD